MDSQQWHGKVWQIEDRFTNVFPLPTFRTTQYGTYIVEMYKL